MILAFWLFLGIVLAAGLFLYFKYGVKLRLVLELLRMEVEDLEGLLTSGTPDVSLKAGPSENLRVMIEIVDPIAVARKESRLGRAFNGIMPNYIRREVYRRVRAEVAQVMQSRGIDAKVTVSHGFSIDA